MYVPPWFQTDRSDLVAQVIERYSFAPLITPGAKLAITHLPFMFEPDKGERGTLIAHMARANSHWNAFEDSLESVVIFQGPHTYVSPTWYLDEQSVPTWNYAVVHAYGQPKVLDEGASIELLMRTLEQFDGRARGYDFVLAREYATKQARAIVAFEMPLSRIEAKFKMSQNKSEGDQKLVRDNLSSGSPEDQEVAEMMAALIGLPSEMG